MTANEIIDLRSDTVTKPCKVMRKQMYKAEVGDNFYKEDKITRDLEEYCAQFFNKEAALFSITGTMCNQIALRSLVQPGNEIILDASYHINYYEYSATSSLVGAVLNLLYATDGIIREEQLLQALNNRHRSTLTGKPTLLCLENSINYHSGKIYPLKIFQNISELAKKNAFKVYLDGARLLNATTALQLDVNQYTICVDALMVSFSKGLGAPAGSVLLGNKELIEEARKYQKWYGGGLHQSGILAAAALHAIQNNIIKLSKDNDKAKLLGQLLQEDNRIKLYSETIETNIVMFSLPSINVDTQLFINLAKKENLLLYPWNSTTIRAVTHYDINEDQIKTAATKIIALVDYFSKNLSKHPLISHPSLVASV